MKFNLAGTALTALSSFAAALPQQQKANDDITQLATAQAAQTNYDVVVVGGGPAGLSAASSLARVRRSVLLIDSADYRNQYTRHVHDVIGSDGVTPAYLRWKGREQIVQYPTVNLTNGTVSRIESTGNENVTSFSITANFSSNGDTTFTARKVILATGLRDIIPTSPGFAESWGKGVYWCPWCDGFEHADQPYGILGPLDKSGNTPLEILTLNKDVIIFANGTDTPENRAIVEKKLPGYDIWYGVHGINVDNRTITSLERLQDASTQAHDPSKPTSPEYDLFRLNFAEGPSVERAAFITNWPSEQRSKLGEESGVQLSGNKLASDASKGMVTNVPGIYAVGDCNNDSSTNVPHAMWSAKRAVVSLHVTLETENANYQISQAEAKGLAKRELSERDVWDMINPRDDLFYGGDFDRL
ncbi:hypothetical protein CERZMDRAFT_98350 [Cercospora zeae-maydis SCOH1-5]|uniref:FAD/NAD(P)-binding domain-containing protein n=1 Tax=Cercospora zeae-maydis SCOH1-5 TaxID=717836 RepID=A0A6A6FDK3_9PEZI|nr:hypothetical protein CERZMDRAFT_98350 [Cercospora zeae-maydis SCOH1-5]